MGDRKTTGDAVTGLLVVLDKQAIERTENGAPYRDILGRECCGACMRAFEVCDRKNAEDDTRQCPGPDARRAMSAWGQRIPLAEDASALRIVELNGPASHAGTEFQRRVAPELLAALDAHLFSIPSPSPGPTTERNRDGT